MITAAVALIMDGFPGLTPAQVVDLVFTTADDLGAPGTDSIYGRGRLNIGRAFQPVGPLMAPMGGTEIGATTLMGEVGPAFGDGLSGNRAWMVSGFDSYGRTFPVNLAGNWINAPAGPVGLPEAPMLWRNAGSGWGARVQAALTNDTPPETLRTPIDRADLSQSPMRIDADLAPGLSVSFAANGARAGDEYEGDLASHIASVDSDLSLRLTTQLNDVVRFALISESGAARSALPFTGASERQATAGRLSFDLDRAGLDFTYGRLREERGVLGLAWGSAFGQMGGGDTAFTGVGAHFDLAEGLRFQASAEFGSAEMAQAGWLEVAEPLRTSTFALQVRGAFRGLPGEATLFLMQPLRVDDGTLAFMAPTATKYGRQSLSFERREFSPAPSGRELRLGLGYSYWQGETLSAFGEVQHIEEPGHVDGAEDGFAVRVGVRVAH